jgi:hypothetical protein
MIRFRAERHVLLEALGCAAPEKIVTFAVSGDELTVFASGLPLRNPYGGGSVWTVGGEADGSFSVERFDVWRLLTHILDPGVSLTVDADTLVISDRAGFHCGQCAVLEAHP